MCLDFFINTKLYEKYTRNKKEFFNSILREQSIRYKNYNGINDNRKLLLLYSIPINEDPLRSESEMLKIKEILEEIQYKRENYKLLPHCSFYDLKDELFTFNPDFIYYSGHSGDNYIFFENKNGIVDKIEGADFIKLIETTNINEIYLNSCSSKDILELKKKTTIKAIGYNRKVSDFQARRLAIYFFLFLLRYKMGFYEAIESSKKFIESEDKIIIPYIYNQK